MLAGLVLFTGPWIAVLAVVTRASAYGVFKPAADSLYTRVDAETRYKTKNFIDTSVWRFGDLVVTSGFNLLRGIGTTVPGLAVLSMIAAPAVRHGSDGVRHVWCRMRPIGGKSAARRSTTRTDGFAQFTRRRTRS